MELLQLLTLFLDVFPPVLMESAFKLKLCIIRLYTESPQALIVHFLSVCGANT